MVQTVTGMKLFLSLLVTGWEGYAEVVRNHIRLAHYLAGELEKNGWMVVNDPLLAVVCFQATDLFVALRRSVTPVLSEEIGRTDARGTQFQRWR
jgi:glutamate/tyrosine decarboxylase-like PLP-dependent enzyme